MELHSDSAIGSFRTTQQRSAINECGAGRSSNPDGSKDQEVGMTQAETSCLDLPYGQLNDTVIEDSTDAESTDSLALDLRESWEDKCEVLGVRTAGTIAGLPILVCDVSIRSASGLLRGPVTLDLQLLRTQCPEKLLDFFEQHWYVRPQFHHIEANW